LDFLRHTFASMAVRGGPSLFDVQKLLGHQDIAITQRYAHLSDDGLKKTTAGVATMMDARQPPETVSPPCP
jgi:site-specific recombinase XerD